MENGCYASIFSALTGIGAGTVYSRGGVADVGGDVVMQKGDTLAGSEGLVLRIMGDSQSYTMLLRTGAATFPPPPLLKPCQAFNYRSV